MQCTCVRHTDLPNTSKLFSDLIYRFDQVCDLYPGAPNNPDAIVEAARFPFPDDRRAAVVRAIEPLNAGNPALRRLAEPGTVAIITGQQVGLFSGPAYSVYKALTAIRIAQDLSSLGVPAVPMFWLATEDHDLAEVDHTWVFGPDHRPVRLRLAPAADNVPRPAGSVPLRDIPIAQLRESLAGFPFAEEATALVERAYQPGATMGSAFAGMVRELFAPYGLLLIDPLSASLRAIAAPLLSEAVARMPELTDAIAARSRELTARGYHAQVFIDDKTSLVFLLENGERTALRRENGTFRGGKRTMSATDLAAQGPALSPNALLRPVMQDYLFPTAAYVGGAAELAYLAQSAVLYEKLLGRQPIAFPRTGFTLIDSRSAHRMGKYHLSPCDLFVRKQALQETISRRLLPEGLTRRLEGAKAAVSGALEELTEDLRRLDPSLASTVATSRRKIEYQAGKIARKTAARMLARDEQARRDAAALSGLVFPEDHLQERLYSIVPFIAKFGPGIVGDLFEHVQVECPDHQFAVV